MKSLIYFLWLLSFTSILFSQNGDPNSRRTAVINGNKIETVINNFGVLAQPSTVGSRFEWKNDGSFFLSDGSLLLGLELPIKDYWRGTTPPDGIPDTIPSVIITDVNRPGGGEDSYYFEPLPGYFNINHNDSTSGFALSYLPVTWPDIWPDKPHYGSGVWNGLYGPDLFVGSQEAYFAVDDFNDLENNIQNRFYADSTDTTITGHGINVYIRYVQLDNPLYEDILFKIYDIENKSLHNYHKLVFGNLTGTYIGNETQEWNNDVTLFYPKDNLIISADYDYYSGNGHPKDVPDGYLGETIIHSPVGNEIASFQNFVPSGDITMSDDYDLWNRLTPGFFDYPSSIIYQDSVPFATRGEDGDYLFGSNYFTLDTNETKRFVTAAVFGSTKSEVLKKVKYAEALFHSEFDTAVVISAISITSHNYHKVVSGSDLVTWNAILSDGTVEIWFSSDGGNDWTTVVSNAPNSGAYNWNTENFDDGAFAKLMILLKDNDGFVYAIDKSAYFSVNNTENGFPFVQIMNDENDWTSTITEEEFDFELLIGDPENEPLMLNVYYNSYPDSSFHLSQSISVSSDTSVQIVPVNFKVLPNSQDLRIKLVVSDGVNNYSDFTPVFTKETSRIPLSNQNYEWIRKYNNVPVEIRIIDSTKISGEEYLITFNDDINNDHKSFSVFNKTSNSYTLIDEPLYPNSESIVFDGITMFTEDKLTQLDPVQSRWNNPHPLNLGYNFEPFASSILDGHRDPFDYLLTFSNSYNDSSNHLYQLFGSQAPPANHNINFKVFRIKDGLTERIQFAFTEVSQFRRDTLSFLDQVTMSDADQSEISWKIVFDGDSSSNIPGAGDTLYLVTEKGISRFDSLRIFDLTVDVQDQKYIPTAYSLSQNFPNPFNPSTTIRYSVSQAGLVELKLYDILGREVETIVNDYKNAGTHEVNLNAKNLASGVYFYRLKVNTYLDVKKMLLLK